MTSNIYDQPGEWLSYELAFVGRYCDAARGVLIKPIEAPA